MANKKDRELPIMYRAWCPEYGGTIEKAGQWGAISIESAAKLEATMNYCKGRDTIVVHVFDPSTDKTYHVIVDVTHSPCFEPRKAEEIAGARDRA